MVVGLIFFLQFLRWQVEKKIDLESFFEIKCDFAV